MTPYNLLVVAHPDDETIFFSGLLLNLRTFPWMVVCVTWDGVKARQDAFQMACRAFDVKECVHWEFEDKAGGLDIPAIATKLQALARPESVFTHSIRGDYGHQHHQDVCMAVHQAFSGHPKVYSLAYTNPEIKFPLTFAQTKTRLNIMVKNYGLNPFYFLPKLPHFTQDGFSRLEYDPATAYPLYVKPPEPQDK